MARSTAALAVVLLSAALATGAVERAEHVRSAPNWPADAAPGHLLVTVASVGALDALPTATRIGERIALVRVPEGAEEAMSRRLARTPGVVAVEPDRLRRLARAPNDPGYPEQWAHAQSGIEGAWSYTTGAAAARIAVIDGGIRGDHPDLRDNIVEQVDAATGTITPRGRGIDNDTCGRGHGTMVAGVIGAVGNNARGVAGVAWQVSLLDIAVSSTSNPTSCETIPDSAVLAAMHYASTHPAGPVDVVNLSLGSRQAYCPEAYDSAIREARALGIVVVVAAGNLGAGGVSVPAACPGVLAVTATDHTGEIASYASTNPWVALAAPGGAERGVPEGAVLTTSKDGDTTTGSGSSFAAAYVAGTVALLRDIRPELTPDEIRSILQLTADEIGQEGEPVRRRLRADTAIAHAAHQRFIPAPQPVPFFPVLRLAPAPAGPGPVRVSSGSPTDPVAQAAAVSAAVFKDHGAVHAVIARADGFADALAGSALGYGVGPLLFTTATGPLAEPAETELRRVLPVGGTVYVLGGERAVPGEAADRLAALGYRTVRLAGATREGTAARTARETVARIHALGFSAPSAVVLVTRSNWPDAVTAGSLGAVYGIPVLLTDADQLHPDTEQALRDLRPEQIFVVGGEASVSTATATAAADVAGARLTRLSGPSRDETAVAVAQRLLAAIEPRYAVAVNIRRDDAYAPALAATTLAGAYGAILVPVEGEQGTVLTEPTRQAVRGLGLTAIVAGGQDMVSEGVARLLQRLLDEPAEER